MNSMNGLERFDHLVDKISLTVDYARKLQQEKDTLQREIGGLSAQIGILADERMRLEDEIKRLKDERASALGKVESALRLIAAEEPEAAKYLKKAV
jgi:cell division protein FtsB